MVLQLLQTEAMISQRCLFLVAPPISPPTKVSKRSLFPVAPPIKAPLLWAAPASICLQLTPTLDLTLGTWALALAITLDTPPSPLCTPYLGPPILLHLAPAAPLGDVP